jgi:DNA-binding response OmpR family regulator
MPRKILLVDDEKDFLDLLAQHLQRGDFEFITAGDGMEALNKARRFLPDVILLDLMLPDLDGLSVCDILRNQASTADIPVILLSALAGEMARLNGLASGANHYLCKPVNMAELLDCIENALAVRSAQVEARNAEAETLLRDQPNTELSTRGARGHGPSLCES